MEFEDDEDFFNIMQHINDFNKNKLKVYYVDRDKKNILFEKEDEILAEHIVNDPDNPNNSDIERNNENDF